MKNNKLEVHIKYGGEWLLAISSDNVRDEYLDTALESLNDKIISHIRNLLRGKLTNHKVATFDDKGNIDLDRR